MQLANRQRGLGLWGWIFVLGVIGFTAMVVLQLTPIYLAEMAIQRVVKSTADNGGSSLVEIRKAMKTRWDVEGITTLRVDEIQLVKTSSGRALHYEYEARAALFYNLSIVATFDQTFPMSGGGSIE